MNRAPDVHLHGVERVNAGPEIPPESNRPGEENEQVYIALRACFPASLRAIKDDPSQAIPKSLVQMSLQASSQRLRVRSCACGSHGPPLPE